MEALPFLDSTLLSALNSPITDVMMVKLEAEYTSSTKSYTGFNTLFNATKAYSNFLFAEVQQLSYSGTIRAVALASTDELTYYPSPLASLIGAYDSMPDEQFMLKGTLPTEWIDAEKKVRYLEDELLELNN